MGRGSAPGTVDTDVQGIAAVHWNPVRRDADGTARSVDNFGDLIGPLVVAGMLDRLAVTTSAAVRRRLLSVGSVLHFAREGDVVWGSGINGKEKVASSSLPPIDVRAVRGPATRRRLRAQGIDVPPVFGDPALLLPLFMPDLVEIARAEPTRDVTIIPNFHDVEPAGEDSRVIDPRRPIAEVLRAIAGSRLIVGSSLHGVVVAEAFGRPARVVRSRSEHYLKYFDYYAGTGRYDVQFAADVSEAIALGGVERGTYDLKGLQDAFPIDLWTGGDPSTPLSGSVPQETDDRIAAGEKFAEGQMGSGTTG
ncbi:polysaccharide pyruvyl transferase family protein [Microbacterium hominis]|uniref:Polysaccharide pyruvyl transferase family protein n=1 Tax=Microbacterium hominis TaxID=162426 RepID=A0A7D4Q251_9MICO|nr:polysaccharide pyruvyl transferase family protein [Microbacterium hominis]QKJ20358.1 polysaccharide pyruvyl transferase family protein [Microbacterium hominis]